MRALVIGGTSGFGAEVSEQFLSQGYELSTVSRSDSGYKGSRHYQCDVGDGLQWMEVLQWIESDHECIDALACIVGHARAENPDVIPIKRKIFDDSFNANTMYVMLAALGLKECLLRSEDPQIITLGSQWSYKSNYRELRSYAFAKHALKRFTETSASAMPRAKINHYCVPTMDTPGYWKVRESFKQIGSERVIKEFTPEGLADPAVVAKTLVEIALGTEESGKTYVIDDKGGFRLL